MKWQPPVVSTGVRIKKLTSLTNLFTVSQGIIDKPQRVTHRRKSDRVHGGEVGRLEK